MHAYFFLSYHPKFGVVHEPNDKSGAKKKGCHMNFVSESAVKKKSRKAPSSSIVANTCPVGKDSTKKAKATQM
jgi:hypothetical protein